MIPFLLLLPETGGTFLRYLPWKPDGDLEVNHTILCCPHPLWLGPLESLSLRVVYAEPPASQQLHFQSPVPTLLLAIPTHDSLLLEATTPCVCLSVSPVFGVAVYLGPSLSNGHKESRSFFSLVRFLLIVRMQWLHPSSLHSSKTLQVLSQCLNKVLQHWLNARKHLSCSG